MFNPRRATPAILALGLLLAGCGVGQHGITGVSALTGSYEAFAKLPTEAKALKTPIGTIFAGLLPDKAAGSKKEDTSMLSEGEADLLGLSIMGKGGQSLPKSADLTSKFEAIRNQGALGSCSAFAATAMMEAMMNSQGKKVKKRLSPLFFYYAERKVMEEGGQARATRKDTGAFMYLAADTAVKTGTVTESEVPYADGKAGLAYDATAADYEVASQFKMKKKARVKTLQGMKSALAKGQPFLLPVVLYDSFMTKEVAQTGMMPMPGSKEEVQGGHAVVAVGYDDTKQAFKIRNSWGADWGQKGYFWMPYAYFKTSYVGSFYYGECWTLE